MKVRREGTKTIVELNELENETLQYLLSEFSIEYNYMDEWKKHVSFARRLLMYLGLAQSPG
jgi:hypothetical protein